MNAANEFERAVPTRRPAPGARRAVWRPPPRSEPTAPPRAISEENNDSWVHESMVEKWQYSLKMECENKNIVMMTSDEMYDAAAADRAKQIRSNTCEALSSKP